MGTRVRPAQLFRPALILIAVLCVAAATPLLAQQAPDSARVAGTISAQPSAQSTVQPGPRVSPRFQRLEPSFTTRSNASAASAFAAQGGHPIVISTLALVLIIVIIVLLVR